mgnify:CR=1 FL=1
MGKVLVDYKEDPVCRRFCADEALIRRVCTAVFISPEWLMLDMGIISEEEGLCGMETPIRHKRGERTCKKSAFFTGMSTICSRKREWGK